MMSVDDAIASEPAKGGRGPTCWFLRWRTFYDEASYAKMTGLLEEVRRGERTGSSVARISSKTGFRLTANQVTYHMRGECGCGQDDE